MIAIPIDPSPKLCMAPKSRLAFGHRVRYRDIRSLDMSLSMLCSDSYKEQFENLVAD